MKLQYREADNLYTIFLVDDKGKELIVPREQCSAEEFSNPSLEAIKYWAHYGIDRTTFKDIPNDCYS